MIDFINKNKIIVLASGSPRRQSLLQQLGINFTVEVKKVDESYPGNLTSTEVAEYIAHKKAMAFDNPEKQQILITADTIVATEQEILGKPNDKIEAQNMLKTLSDNTHWVITGVCLRDINQCHLFHSTTKVTFEPLTDELIKNYIEKEKPFDKAGAYGIQEWFGMVAVKHIEGSYFNVMGLPVHKLYQKLIEIA